MSCNGGNLEAGVIFAPEGLQWYPGTKMVPNTSVGFFLPIQWEKKITQGTELSAGCSLPPAEEPFVAPPLAWIQWAPREGGGHLLSTADVLATSCEVLNGAGLPCEVDALGVLWPGQRPRQVCLRWATEGSWHESLVPVMDEFGRLAATPLTALDFSEAWWGLADFPAAVGGEDGEADEDETGADSQANDRGGSGVAAYPIRQMMELLERIAERQTCIPPADWGAWCTRLEQTLSRVGESQVLSYFRELGVNPLSPLRVSAFRPGFAENAASPEGLLYEQMLARLEENWQTASLKEIAGVSA
ncbi:hypothetical protein D9M68_564910 [compost metagenome]